MFHFEEKHLKFCHGTRCFRLMITIFRVASFIFNPTLYIVQFQRMPKKLVGERMKEVYCHFEVLREKARQIKANYEQEDKEIRRLVSLIKYPVTALVDNHHPNIPLRNSFYKLVSYF